MVKRRYELQSSSQGNRDSHQSRIKLLAHTAGNEHEMLQGQNFYFEGARNVTKTPFPPLTFNGVWRKKQEQEIFFAFQTLL